MSVKTVAFFNNVGGVGKTSLVYHLSWMFADRGKRILSVDLDPKANLTAAFLSDGTLESIWPDDINKHRSISGAIRPLQMAISDVESPYLSIIDEKLALIPGDVNLYSYEDDLSKAWPACLAGDERAFRVTSAFWRIMQDGASQHQADIILIDLGTSLGALNRSALIASDFIITPLGPDLFSLQGLRNHGPAIQKWRDEWKDCILNNPNSQLNLPPGDMKPIGYVIFKYPSREDRPVSYYEKWISRIPLIYHTEILNSPEESPISLEKDKYCLALLKHYRSLMPMAQEARKPIFFLKPADGVLGSHTYAVQEAYKDFLSLAKKIGSCVGIELQ
jgi:chromosome partitioning protein